MPQVDDYLRRVGLDPTKENTTHAEKRSVGRYEIRPPLSGPFINPGFIQNPLMVQP